MTQKITAATTDAKFVAADDQMIKAEELYSNFERELQSKISNVRLDYPGYHAYHLDVAKIGHDPYVLIAILSAVKADFNVNDPEIVQMFDIMKQPRHQYTLTISKRVADEFADNYAFRDVEPFFRVIYALRFIVDVGRVSLLSGDYLSRGIRHADRLPKVHKQCSLLSGNFTTQLYTQKGICQAQGLSDKYFYYRIL